MVLFRVIAPPEGPHTTTPPAVGPKPGTIIHCLLMVTRPSGVKCWKEVGQRGPEGQAGHIIVYSWLTVHGTIKRRLLIYRAKIKNKFYCQNRRNRCNRVTRANKPLLYIEILSYISRKQKSNRIQVCVTRKSKIAYSGVKSFFIYF